MLAFCQMQVTKILALLLLCAMAAPGLASELVPEPTPAGLWRTIDDKTGKPRGFVRLYEENGELFGKVEKSLDPKEAKERCDKCSGERKDQPVVGMVILRRMKKSGSQYIGGDILDPDTGAVYRCILRLVEDGRKLVVRGYLGATLFGRSQTWVRAD